MYKSNKLQLCLGKHHKFEMAFIDISDPKKRDEIVRDYINTRLEIQNKSENEKALGLQQRINLEKQYQPLIQATKDSTNKITTELKNSRSIKESNTGYWNSDFVKPAIDYYLSLKTNRDKYYGIQKRGNTFLMGDSNIDIDKNSNIYVKDRKFRSSPGLWELIMLNKPQNYTAEDAMQYEDLIEATQVIFNPLTKKESDRPQQTAKYKDLLADMRKSYDEQNPETEETEALDEGAEALDEGAVPLPEGEVKTAQGIKYLPGNKKGLLDRLKLLYAEREAGNISATTSEIVGILDELLRMSYITRKQYNEMCSELKC